MLKKIVLSIFEELTAELKFYLPGNSASILKRACVY